MRAGFDPAYFDGAVKGGFQAAGKFISCNSDLFAAFPESCDEDEDVFRVFVDGACFFAVSQPSVFRDFVSQGDACSVRSILRTSSFLPIS